MTEENAEANPTGATSSRAPIEGADLCPARNRPWVLVATILASAMGFIDGALMPIALPSIGRDLDASFGALQWMTNLYLLALSALIVVGGGLGDLIGRRRVFIFGIVLFAIASAACAAAMTPEQLIAARGAKGVGAAFMIPQSLAIITACYPKEQRGGAIGVWASASALTTVLGPVIGGVFVDTLGWRAAFWINLPLAAICLAITFWRVPENRAAPKDVDLPDAAPTWRRLDWAGSGLIAIGLGASAWAMIAAPERGFDVGVGLALAATVLAFAALPRVERRAQAPIVPPELAQNAAFLAANAVTLMLYGGLAAVLFLLPFDLIGARGYSAFEVGVALAPFGLVIGLFSHPVGRIVERVGARRLLTIGGSMFALACIFLAVAPPGLGYWLAVFPALIVMGGALAVSIAPVTTAVMNAAPEQLVGAASGVNNAVSRAAGLVSVAAIGALTAWVYRQAVAGADAAAPHPLTLAEAIGVEGAGAPVLSAMTVGYAACAALGIAAVLVAQLLPRAARETAKRERVT